MLPIGVVWSVSCFVCESVTIVNPAKTTELMGCGLAWNKGTMYYMVVQILHAKEQCEGKWAVHCKV